MTDLKSYDDAVEAEYRRKSEDDFLLFARGLTIPSAFGPRLFSTIIQPFQVEFFEDMAPSLTAMRNGDEPPCRRFWLERTKKSAKDADVAICLLWPMVYPRRPILGQVCAANQDQANVVKERISDILYYNPWLNDRVELLVNRITNPGRIGKIKIEATESGGSAHGPAPDFLVLNELTHVAKWPVMESHMNNAYGTPRGIVVVVTNSGFKGTKPEKWKKNAVEKKRWRVHIFKGIAPWLKDEDIEDAKLTNLPSEYQRLWRGKWVSGIGQAVEEAVIDRCFSNDLEPLDRPEKGWVYGAGLDLGISHDHSALDVVGMHLESQRIRVAQIHSWEPDMLTAEGKMEVDLVDVEKRCVEVNKIFRLAWLYYDPAAGGSFMAQRLERQGVQMRKMSFSSPTNLTAMAEGFVQVMNDGILSCFEDERMRRDFGKFDIVKKLPSGFRLTAVSDEHGHADVGTALVVVLPAAIEMLGLGGFGLGDEEELVSYGDDDLSEEEVKDMPDELREIYEMDDEEERGRRSFGGGSDEEDW